MRAKFVKKGRYAHVNDARSPQFYISEEAAKEGLIVGDLSEETIDTYVGTGACERLKEDEVNEPEDSEDENESSKNDDVVLSSITDKDNKKRKRGNR